MPTHLMPLASSARASHHWSVWRKVARPPAEQPEITASVASFRPWLARSSAYAASRMRLPRQCSVAPLYGCTVSLLPEKEPPSQYGMNTEFQLYIIGFSAGEVEK